MLKVGITGGIGSGKSVVCRLFNTCGAPVYDADEAAKRIMHENINVITGLKATFGDIYDSNNLLQKDKLASFVFSNPDMLKKLNSIVHPAVFEDYEKWEERQDYAYVIRESAILFESFKKTAHDYVIFVESPEKLRIKRTLERDKRTAQQIRDIINRQMPEEQKKTLADFVIVNDDTLPLLPQVWSLHDKFLNGK